MNGKYIVLTLLIGASLSFASLNISELLVDNNQSNDIDSKDTIPLILNKSINEDHELDSDTTIKTKPLNIMNSIKEDTSSYNANIENNKVIKADNLLEMDNDEINELFDSEEDDPSNISSMELSYGPIIPSYSLPTIEYMIGFITDFGKENWSPWISDGNEANVKFGTWTVPGTYAMKVRAPGYHVEYKIGYKEAFGTEYWSPWTSDGNEANVTYDSFTIPGTFAIKIRSPGNHVEYQIGYWGDWSPWTSNGLEANITFNTFTPSLSPSIRAIMVASIQTTIDIDPNTLNLKSKGKWITCYITLNDPYDPSDIDISTILLEDTIPAEWGDIQGDRLMVKFDRSDVQALLPVGTYKLKVTGELTDGTSLEGYSDEIRVIDPGK